MSLTPREKFLSLDNLPGEFVEAFGSRYFIATVGAEIRAAVVRAQVNAANDGSFGADFIEMVPSICVAAVRDAESKARMFTKADLPVLAELDQKELQRMALIAIKHSGMGVNAVEDAGKNSVGIPSESSASS